MLILTRRIGETLMVGDEITISVLGVKGNQVRIGVNAPKDVSVHREEIYQKIQCEGFVKQPLSEKIGKYRIKKDVQVRVGVSSFTAKEASIVNVRQVDNENDKVLVQFGSGVVDWFHVSWLEKHTIRDYSSK